MYRSVFDVVRDFLQGEGLAGREMLYRIISGLI